MHLPIPIAPVDLAADILEKLESLLRWMPVTVSLSYADERYLGAEHARLILGQAVL